MKKIQLFKKLMPLALLLLSGSSFSQITEQWANRYNGPGNSEDEAIDMAVDASGNVYVTGFSYSSDRSNSDYVTIKYNAAGAELWVKRYNGPGNSRDEVSSLVIDASGNVYVTGYSQLSASSSNSDYATLKYDAAGNELWVRRYKGPWDFLDGTASLAVDASGNVYVTGSSRGSGIYNDYATIKYDAVGNEVWVRRYNGGSGNGPDRASDVAVDASGNVYVTGSSSDSSSGYGGLATIKYNAAGAELWVKEYAGGYSGLLAVDASGNVYVAGYGESVGNVSQSDYITIKYDGAGTELWVSRYTGAGSESVDAVKSMAVDGSGNVYVTGYTYSSETNYDYATIKYDAAGNELWVRLYNGTIDNYDIATSLVIDGSGNVYVTGRSDQDYATIKYDAAGTQLWVKRYDGFRRSFDIASSLAIDSSGNLYVTGTISLSSGSYNNDYATVKYTQTAQAVSSFTLINADTDTDIRELKQGDTINLETLSTLNLSIRANTNPATVGSVSFNLSGAEIRNYTENLVPYALFADNKTGDYYAWTPANGSYTLTGTPYEAAKGTGTKGTPLTIRFTVTGQVVRSLILVNADTDQDIQLLKNGDVVDLSSLSTANLNIRAAVHPDTVGSVVFNLNNQSPVKENIVPYAIGGDIKGNYRPWTLPPGNHVLTATPYTGKSGTGRKGKALAVSFTVTDQAAVTRTANHRKSIAETNSATETLRATPNPFATRTTIRFSVPRSGYTTVQVYNSAGMVVERLYQAWAEAGKTYQVPLERNGLQSGMYILKVANGKYEQSKKLVIGL